MTALAVTAPLAVIARDAGRESGVVAPADGGVDPGDVRSSDHGDLTLDGDEDSQGGIGTKPRSKAQGQTGKAESTTTTVEGQPTTTDIPTLDPAAGNSAGPAEGASGKPIQPAPTTTTSSTTSTTVGDPGTAAPTTTSTTTPSTTSSTVTGTEAAQATD